MTFPMTNMLATLAAAAIFAVIFYYQSWWRWPPIIWSRDKDKENEHGKLL